MSASPISGRPVINSVSNSGLSLSCSKQAWRAGPPTFKRAMIRATFGRPEGMFGCNSLIEERVGVQPLFAVLFQTLDRKVELTRGDAAAVAHLEDEVPDRHRTVRQEMECG